MAKYKIIPSSRTIVQLPISIGHKAEKGVEAIEFDLTAWVETYGSGTLTVIMRRWGDAIPYPIALEIDENNKATWTLSDIDTAKAGMAYAQLSYIVGETVVKKSDIYTFRVMDSLTGEGEPPEAYESWLEQLTHLAAVAMAEVLDIEGIVTDKTLTVDGGIADGKATGDALALKADRSTTYTKTEVDTLIESVDVETDTTLSVSGKPADAKTVGDELGAINESLGDVRADLQSLYAKKDSSDFTWTIRKTIGPDGRSGINNPTALTDKFAVTPGCTITNKSDAVGMNDKSTIFMVAQFEGNTFKSRTSVNAGESLVLNNDTDSVMLVFGYAGSSHNVETQEDVDAHFKVIIAEPLATVREVETIEAGVGNIFTRTSYGRQIADNPGALTTETVDGVEVTTLHLDLVLLPGKYIINSNHVIDGAPTGFTPQFIIVDNFRYVYSTRFLRQTIGGVTIKPDTIYYRFTNTNSVWQDWQFRAGTTQIDNSYTYNNENTYESNVTQNSYTVSASPSITTDNLYYLAPSGDTTDRTTDIATILNTNGICRLGSGTYYVSNLQMPNDSQIIGVGASTIIRLADSVTDGYAIRMSERCTVKDCMILGSESYTPMVESAVTPGNRVGVLWYGADNVLPYYGVLDNVRIGRFAGSGIKLYNTSKQVHTKLTATNCYIEYCDVGINIAYISEFNQFANCTIRKCYYGAINNGGNNTFSTCEFCSNIIHFLIDNSSGTMENNTHSGITNCVFGHAMGFVDHVLTSNKGTAIKIIGVNAGFIFTSCYNGYGKTEIEDSSGILFNGCMWSGYSNNDIKIVRGGGITFATCLFTSLPPITITDNTSVVSHGCRLKSGADVVVE